MIERNESGEKKILMLATRTYSLIIHPKTTEQEKKEKTLEYRLTSINYKLRSSIFNAERKR